MRRWIRCLQQGQRRVQLHDRHRGVVPDADRRLSPCSRERIAGIGISDCTAKQRCEEREADLPVRRLVRPLLQSALLKGAIPDRPTPLPWVPTLNMIFEA